MALDRPAFRRRRLTVTSLIDVIFLLLLFFMLSSTFSRYGELELTGARPGTGNGAAPAFVQIGPGRLALNGRALTLSALPAALAGHPTALVSLDNGTTAQRLVDLLAALRGVPGLSVTVLE